MKFFAVLVALGAMSQTASAQTPDCKSIADPGPRLACYDSAAPPATAKSAASARVPVSKVEPAKYVDPIGAEDALMSARLKNICHGC
jgi:sugar/nucleoside kinase (ribokinase family)